MHRLDSWLGKRPAMKTRYYQDQLQLLLWQDEITLTSAISLFVVKHSFVNILASVQLTSSIVWK